MGSCTDRVFIHEKYSIVVDANAFHRLCVVSKSCVTLEANILINAKKKQAALKLTDGMGEKQASQNKHTGLGSGQIYTQFFTWVQTLSAAGLFKVAACSSCTPLLLLLTAASRAAPF